MRTTSARTDGSERPPCSALPAWVAVTCTIALAGVLVAMRRSPWAPAPWP